MKSLLRVFRNFFILFAIFVGLGMLLANSEDARNFVTPEGSNFNQPAE